MPKRLAYSTLNASTIDILNVIRENASSEYRDLVPEVETEKDIPRVGEVLYGYPSLANAFISALVNRIALVLVHSSEFKNPLAELVKGELLFGETVEEIFVGIAKARVFSYDKAEQRELKRTPSEIRSAFHVANWNVQYPVTVTELELQKAFLSMEGVQDLIARIVDSVYRAEEYDCYLLFKYMLIKGIAHGKFKPVSIGTGAADDMKTAAVAFRGYSNQLTFLSDEYNEAGVLTNTPKERGYIFMDSNYAAQFDVEVLSAAFNLDKAEYMGRLRLIDDWTTFDNNRFDVIRKDSDMVEEVTAAELQLLQNVKAVYIDEQWFQVYYNIRKFSEKYVASADYWNYFYHVQMTISNSPFANAVVFVTDSASVTLPETLTGEIVDKSMSENAVVLSILVDTDGAGLTPHTINFVQTQAATEAGIAIHKAGAVIYPSAASTTTLELDVDGTRYTAASATTPAANVGDTITFNKG